MGRLLKILGIGWAAVGVFGFLGFIGILIGEPPSPNASANAEVAGVMLVTTILVFVAPGLWISNRGHRMIDPDTTFDLHPARWGVAIGRFMRWVFVASPPIWYCKQCGNKTRQPKLRGSTEITFLLSCAGLIPGLVYGSWRRAGPRVCPSCRTANLIPAESIETPPVATAATIPPRAAPPSTWRVERPCPYCAEPILAQAIVCKHCGRDVPSAPPRELHIKG